jgi:hypothetical protein
MNLTALREAVADKLIVWHKHTLERMLERNISRSHVMDVLIFGEVIEEYPDDRPFASALIFGMPTGQPLHVVTSFDPLSSTCHIITVYRPDSEHFNPDNRTRRSK